ncbi:Peptidyl-tRNA hydrolase (EC [Olavius algarvensis associated proteobacterium Delta 3]|nr:Peptidyl-tRNA hydrolase (EC [Olavius algarvensis associated proteobacterium Delta 3]CAB5153145.1 Peptidyl-tRNA hydrolase (EC [Olavius algarvensis associated proteobacterium Delta 3]
MPEHILRLVVGLGNPGAGYQHTRHNAGFVAIDAIADAYGVIGASERVDNDIWFARSRIATIDVMLAKPLAFMNRSGPPVHRLADRFGIPCEDLLVVHDDIDLELGRIKIKEKGGDGGHRGISSLIDAFGRNDFTRLRIGIGRPQPGVSVTDHVLGRFSAEEREILGLAIEGIPTTVVTILRDGTAVAMNRFNSR